MKYTLSSPTIEPKLEWEVDSGGDWQLFFYEAKRKTYWGMVCPHNGSPQIVADGRSLINKQADTLEGAKSQAENYCIEDMLRRASTVRLAERRKRK